MQRLTQVRTRLSWRLALLGLAMSLAASGIFAASATPALAATPLTVNDAVITAKPSDKLLNRTIKFSTIDPTDKVARYEYGWGNNPVDTVPTKTQSCATTLAQCFLNYGAVKPSTSNSDQWDLMVRAVGTNGQAGPWHVQQVHPPKAPVLVVGGDSILSGHHRDSATAITICHDDAYSLGQTVWTKMQAALPTQWREPYGYINVAQSGFNTGQMRDGGSDACGSSHVSEMVIAQAVLQDRTGSWNIVVWDGGIDDTNWVDILSNVITEDTKGNIRNSAQCDSLVAAWNFTKDPTVRPLAWHDTYTIAHQIDLADPMAKSYWTSYYNVANTGPATGKCTHAFATAMQAMNTNQQSALGDTNVRWVDLNPILGSNNNLLQNFYLSDILFKKAGWPHPNRQGASQVGSYLFGLAPKIF